jgi:hypothetical protein
VNSPIEDEMPADLLAAHLARRDEPCPCCGYNLRGLRSARCPECAQELVLRVNLREPRLAGYVAGIVGLAAGVGFSGLLLIYAIIVFGFVRGGGWVPRFVLTTGGGLLVEGLLLWLWIRNGSRIRRFQRRARVWLVVGCWILTVTNLFVFILAVR